MELFLFEGLLIILVASLVFLLIGHRLHTLPVAGFSLTGALSGPQRDTRDLWISRTRNDCDVNEI
jgi:hypothetical protein